jgi:type II secretory pathway pseudopilin PulG
MSRADRPRQGVALLEVLVAITILGTAGLALVTLSIDASRTVERAAISEAGTERASDLFDHVAQWDRTDLDRHLGDHTQGPWRLEVQRTTSTLYSLRLRDSTGLHAIIATTLYRPMQSATERAP